MKHTSARLSLFAAALGLAFFASCHTTDTRYNHWRFEGLTPRVAYHLLAYDTNSGKPYYEHANAQRSAINLTVRRHLLNNNPENPFQRKLAWIPGRKRFSPLPDPIHFLHLSSVAFASASLGAGGAFFLFPPDALIVLFEEGGAEEMWDGIADTFTGRLGEPEMPPDPSEFKVRNR
jgi:hypothetical protein